MGYGSSSLEKRIKENIGSLEVKLSEEERKIITGF